MTSHELKDHVRSGAGCDVDYVEVNEKDHSGLIYLKELDDFLKAWS
jgi:hypothetical protein